MPVRDEHAESARLFKKVRLLLESDVFLRTGAHGCIFQIDATECSGCSDGMC